MTLSPLCSGTNCYHVSGSDLRKTGVESGKIGEHPNSSGNAIVTIDVEAYPEPKALSPAILSSLARQHGGWTQATRVIGGVSEGFIRQNAAVARRGRSKS